MSILESIRTAPVVQNGEDLGELDTGKYSVPNAVRKDSKASEPHTWPHLSCEQRVLSDAVESLLKLVKRTANLIGRLALQKVDGIVDIALRGAINKYSEGHAL